MRPYSVLKVTIGLKTPATAQVQKAVRGASRTKPAAHRTSGETKASPKGREKTG